MTRRQALLLPAAALLRGQPPAPAAPRNLSYPLRVLEASITPADMFFVRDHFSEPDLSMEDWTLSIEGRVDRPYKLSFSDLLEAPSTKFEAVLECAGNKASGSAASNGLWEGVALKDLLGPAGVQLGTEFLLFEGADSGKLFSDTPEAPYVQLLPIRKCMDAASIVAYKVNGRFLPRGNGFPARALFPGWYAMDSVKWLRRIVALGPNDPSPFVAGGMNRLYNRRLKTGGEPVRLTRIEVKSAIAWPVDEQALPAGNHRIWGFAWAGERQIRAVSVSCDGGKNWGAAKLDASPGPYRWVRWSFRWTAAPGDYVVLSRAVDSGGTEQPLERNPQREDGYELNWCLPVHCRVV